MFKTCTYCGHAWRSRQVFLADPSVTLVGYQVHFEDLSLGLFLFEHAPCKSTFAVVAGQFTDLYNGPVFEGRKTGTDDCPEYCLRKEELRPCPAQCECAYVRQVLQKIVNWPKTAA